MEIKPLKGRVFAKRHRVIDSKHGMQVSERAVWKNPIATVTASGSKMVSVGDRIHLPVHLAYIDTVKLDGEEVECVRDEHLFTVYKGGDFHPINGYVRMRKCVNDHIRDESGEIQQYLTERGLERTEWAEIVSVADDCKKSPLIVGWFFPAPLKNDRMHRLLDTEDWFIHEDLIEFITDGL